jgi:hypothetical protein
MNLRVKIGLAALAGSMAAAPLAIGFAGPASASNPDNLSQFCTANGDLGLSSHGQCVSTLQTSNNLTPAGACKYMQTLDPPGYYEQYFGNTGSCVSYFAQN